jgi:hypothetical protein
MSDDAFDAWCDQLGKLRYPWSDQPVTHLTGRGCWRTYFSEGWTPEDALAEDQKLDS